jgi:hypothetical protein
VLSKINSSINRRQAPESGEELTPDDLLEIESAASKIAAQGARYPENLEKLSER